MPTNTPNLNLIKPLVSETYTVAVANANNDILDTAVGGLAPQATTYTKAEVDTQVGILAPKDNPTFTGTQTLPDIVTNGIKFPATQVPSADPNTLDDYEKGTFTPYIYGETIEGVGTYTSQVGQYTKVGNQVTIQVYLIWTAHTGTGNMRIGGLPFSALGNGAVSIGVFGQIPLTANSFPTMHCSGSTIRFRQSAIAGGTSQSVPMTSSSNGLVVGGTYLTT